MQPVKQCNRGGWLAYVGVDPGGVSPFDPTLAAPAVATVAVALMMAS